MTSEQDNGHSVCLRDRVLVVDDQYGIRILIKEILKKDGIETLLAANGTQALKLFVEEKPSLVLLDMRIPGMSGVEILKKIKEINPETAVMIMTAYGDDEMLAESRKNGAAAYFPKPFDIGELLRTVRQALAEQEKKSSDKL